MSATELLTRLEALGVEVRAEGERLRVSAARGQLDEATKAEIAARKGELLAVLAARGARGAIPRIPRDGPLPLSPFQERLWLLQRIDPASTAYNMAAVWPLRGAPDAACVRRAVEALVRRNELLHAVYRDHDGVPAVHLAPIASVPVETRDLRAESRPAQEAAVRIEAERAAHEPFDLAARPPVRFAIFLLAEGRVAVMMAAHHIALDAWSIGLLSAQLAAAVARDGAPEDGAAGEPPLQYPDFAAWQRTRLEGEAAAGELAWWKRRLAGIPPLSTFPPDGPAADHPAGALHPFRLGRELTAQLQAMAQAEGATLYMALVAACAAVLRWYTGQDDLVLGSPAGLRDRPEFEEIVGPFVQVLPLRLDLSDDPSFAQLLGRSREALLDALAHREVPFERVVEQVNPARSRDHAPLYQVAVVQHSGPLDLTATVTSGGAIHDLTWFARLVDGELVGAMEYRTDLYTGETLERICARIAAVLAAAVADPHRPLSSVALLSPEERELVLERFNATEVDTDAAPFVVQFERQVAATPDACAVTCRGEALSYRELDQAANRVGWLLRGAGVGPGEVVGLCLRRSLELVPTLLGVHKAGGAYLPLDPDFPSERLAYMLEDSGARVVLTDGSLPAGVAVPAGVTIVDLLARRADLAAGPAGPPPLRHGPGDLAYLIYTSGSTGRPKGVRVRQGELSNLLASMRADPGMSPEDVLAAVTTLSFDIAGVDMYLPLLTGARVHVVAKDVASSGAALARELAASGATVLQATPATWRMLLETTWRGPPGFRALCGGEPLPRELASAILERASALWNLYGPTETTIYSTGERVGPEGPVLIGRPVANTRVYVLNRGGQPVAPGVVGELWIGGAGVAEGYHGRPELTAERFVPDPFARRPGARMYRTGDLGRWRPDGRIEHLGRIDHQVKVRGFRIELGEIEAALATHPDVRQAVVTAREVAPGDVRLVAHVVPAEKAPDVGELRTHLRRSLPEYMVPAAFVVLPELPLTPNGKVDRKALPVPAGVAAHGEVVPPRDALEAELVRIWSELLGAPVESVRTPFFDLGGHSLLAARMFARIEQATGVDLPLAVLLEEGTIEHVAARLRERQEGSRAAGVGDAEPGFARLVAIRRGGRLAPLFCVHGAGGNVLNLHGLARHLRHDRPFYAFQARGLDGRTEPHRSIEAMAAEYLGELRAVQPAGPYLLSGYCGGGLVALEMAQRLQAAGERVAFLGLIDLWWPGMPRKETRRQRWLRLLRQEAPLAVARMARARLGMNSSYHRTRLRIWLHRAAGRAVPFALRDFWLTREFMLATLRYAPRRYDGRVAVFRARDGGYDFLQDPGPDLGWSRVALQGVDARETPGDHYTSMLEPNVRLLAEELEDAIVKAEQAPLHRAG